MIDTVKDIRDSWEEIKISTLTGVWKKLVPALTNDLEGFRFQWRKELQMWWKQEKQDQKWSLKM